MTLITIPGYHITQQIYAGSKSCVYRGFSESEQKPVVIKLLTSEYPTFNELVQFRNQYTITKNLNLPGIVKPIALEKYRNGLALVMEDFGGINLKDWQAEVKNCSITDRLSDFFNIAIQIVQALEGLYHHRVIHKDIKPHNILINLERQEIQIIDFSIASLLPRETQEIQNPNVLEGTLAYISPEQTGRMNRGIDYRTDFYSLGVTLYELLTGELPFKSTDAMELVHYHIARQPIPPIQVNSAIPQMVSDIAIKLMAKTAEDRYQSAFGLRYDLEICSQQWLERGSISHFSIGGRDICDRFVIPEKLYGRETEVATLLAAFDRVAGEANPEIEPNNQSQKRGNQPKSKIELMLVAGFSGIGKTAVVNEIHKPIVRQRGYFIKGKFDQFKRDIPFSAWVQAFQNLIGQLLTESATQVQQWQEKILAALGENGQVIIDVIPELEILIGKQPSVLELEGTAAQNRFNLLFQKFIRLFATKEHPLVIFLDDLQWVDSASLNLLQLLMSEPDTCHLLLIGAYRDNEVFPAHPLMLSLAEIRKTDATVNQINLSPLAKNDLNRLIADTLSCPPSRAIPLTELVLQKTKGNPFFSNQFLKALQEDGIISFDFNTNYWQCDMARAIPLSFSEDVVEFMATKLQKLPEKTQNVLKLAACIGNQFDLKTLAIVREETQTETAVGLWRALQEGLVIPINNIYKFFQDDSVANESEQLTVPYKFLHDRVQQAAYLLIPEDQKKSTHLKIGQLLLNNTTPEERDEQIFDIVNQLNMGVELIDEQIEKNELAQLNLIAARKAKASTAYVAAQRYLTVARDLIPTDSWVSSYEFTLELYLEATEIAYLSIDFEQMEQLATVVLSKAKTILDRVKVYEVKLQAYTAQGKLLEAVKIGLQVLNLLGVNLPESPTPLDVEQALKETKTALMERNIEDLINLPLMTDPYKLAAMRIILHMVPAAYISLPALFPLLGCQQVNLSLKYGNTPVSACGYADYGIILNFIEQDIESAYKFGCLAINLVERLNAATIKAHTFFKVGTFLIHGKNHAKETLPLFAKGYLSGLETGDIELVGYNAKQICDYSYLIGQELSDLERQMAIYTSTQAQFKRQTALNWTQIFRQAVLNLLGKTTNPCCLQGEAYNEDQFLPIHLEANDRTGLFYFYFHKLILCYLFGQYAQAWENAAKAEVYSDGVPGMLDSFVFPFYDSLTALAYYPNADAVEQANILKKVAVNQEKMLQWAHHAPMNYLHKFYLVEAEKHRVLGEKTEAMENYERAICGANQNEYINEEALANELTAKFYLAWGKEKIAQVYLTDAYYGYASWGTKAKIEDLEKRYPQLLAPIIKKNNSPNAFETIVQNPNAIATISNSDASHLLELATVIKSFQAISGQNNFSQLLSIFLTGFRENTGAEKAILILEVMGKLEIYAQSFNEQCHLENLPVLSSEFLPLSAINYAWRTQEILAINDISTDATFAADPYIIEHKPKSVLCLPFQYQGRPIGIIYLENNLNPGAFAPDRVAVLKILSSQAAISMENARLYQNLEDKVQERTAFLAQANEEISSLNEKLKAENLRLSSELEAAKRFRRTMLPKESTETEDID